MKIYGMQESYKKFSMTPNECINIPALLVRSSEKETFCGSKHFLISNAVPAYFESERDHQTLYFLNGGLDRARIITYKSTKKWRLHMIAQDIDDFVLQISWNRVRVNYSTIRYGTLE